MNETLTVIAMNMVMIIHVMALPGRRLRDPAGFHPELSRDAKAIPRPASISMRRTFSYARWLVGGLTFQLAADIVESAFSPSLG